MDYSTVANLINGQSRCPCPQLDYDTLKASWTSSWRWIIVLTLYSTIVYYTEETTAKRNIDYLYKLEEETRAS